MNIFELTEIKKPILYIDMDGVQCDFFGGWTKRTGEPHTQAVSERGVDIKELAHSSPEEVFEFFSTLEPLPGGMKMLEFVNKHNIPYQVLTSPLRGPYRNNSIEGKKVWLKKYTPKVLATAIYESEKYKYAGTQESPNVLVDDYDKNLVKWDAQGGIAIKYLDEYLSPQAGDLAIAQLAKIYL